MDYKSTMDYFRMITIQDAVIAVVYGSDFAVLIIERLNQTAEGNMKKIIDVYKIGPKENFTQQKFMGNLYKENTVTYLQIIDEISRNELFKKIGIYDEGELFSFKASNEKCEAISKIFQSLINSLILFRGFYINNRFINRKNNPYDFVRHKLLQENIII